MKTWKEFKQWAEKNGIKDDMIFVGMDYEGDFSDARLNLDDYDNSVFIGYYIEDKVSKKIM